MEPLDGYMSDALKKKFAGLLTDEVNQMEGKTLSLPNFAFTSRLIYNVELFEKAGIAAPPKTVNEMVETAKKLREAGKDKGAYGFAVNFKNPANAYDKTFKVIAQMSGYGGYGYDNKTGQFDFAPHKDILKAFRQMKSDGSMLPGVEGLDIDPLRAQFAEGKIGMYLSLSSEVGVFKDQFPAKIKWAAAPIPTLDGNIKGASDMLNGGTWLVMNKNSKAKDKAWKFIEYMYTDDVLNAYYQTGQGITLVPSVTASGKKPSGDNIEGFLPNKYDAIWPVSPTVKQEGLAFPDVFARIYLDNSDIDKALADLNTRYNAALEKERAAGTVKLKADPSFDPAKLQGTVAK
jgi:multiple sugar transport system substrate-binding protein